MGATSVSLGPLSERYMGQAKARCYLFGGFAPLRDFRKVHSMKQNRLSVRKSPGNGLSGPPGWGRESQAITRAGQRVLGRLMRYHPHLPAL